MHGWLINMTLRLVITFSRFQVSKYHRPHTLIQSLQKFQIYMELLLYHYNTTEMWSRITKSEMYNTVKSLPLQDLIFLLHIDYTCSLRGHVDNKTHFKNSSSRFHFLYFRFARYIYIYMEAIN